MKVFDLSSYRRQREIASLEAKMSELAQKTKSNTHEMKTCFKEWLVKTGSLQ